MVANSRVNFGMKTSQSSNTYDEILKARLPYLLRLPIEGGLVLKARETWPRATRVSAH